ncbi:Histone H4.1 [Fusarium oxysporum f. sp. albedinis]|nr:Histone H4.1 [Fusarium oxysporum f. sp. albedinis]
MLAYQFRKPLACRSRLEWILQDDAPESVANETNDERENKLRISGSWIDVVPLKFNNKRAQTTHTDTYNPGQGIYPCRFRFPSHHHLQFPDNMVKPDPLSCLSPAQVPVGSAQRETLVPRSAFHC